MRYSILLLLALFSCQSRQNNGTERSTVAEETMQGGEPTEADAGIIQELETNFDDLAELPLGLRTLKDFELHGNVRATETNDSLFMEFLEAFTTYQNEANDLLYNDPNYDTYNTLAYSPDGGIAPEALKFQDSVKQIGFVIGAVEGSIYLQKDPEFLDRFSPYLSQRMNSFKDEYGLEGVQPMASDGGLVISTGEHIRRMLFWDNFASDHPDFEWPEYAAQQFERYLFCLMFGLDNTPIYEGGSKVQTELIEAYNAIIKEHPNSKAAGYLTDYLRFLEQQDFRYDYQIFDTYAREKFPTRY